MINMKQTSSGTKRTTSDIYNEHSPMMLINEIARVELDFESEQNEKYPNMNETARFVLIKISENEDCTQQDIIWITHMKKPTVSVIISRFEREEFITRNVNEIDHRSARINLTERGRHIVDILLKKCSEEERIATDGLTVNEYDMLVKLLSKVRYNLYEEKKRK